MNQCRQCQASYNVLSCMVTELHTFVCTVMHATNSMHAITHDFSPLPLLQCTTMTFVLTDWPGLII